MSFLRGLAELRSLAWARGRPAGGGVPGDANDAFWWRHSRCPRGGPVGSSGATGRRSTTAPSGAT